MKVKGPACFQKVRRGSGWWCVKRGERRCGGAGFGDRKEEEGGGSRMQLLRKSLLCLGQGQGDSGAEGGPTAADVTWTWFFRDKEEHSQRVLGNFN